MKSDLPAITEKRRLASPAITPQALAWADSRLWMGSRDLRRIYSIEPKQWNVLQEMEAPGIPWAAVAMNGGFRFTIGEGSEDDRYIYRYDEGGGFVKLFPCPELTGSYLSTDGKNLYLSQWYNKRILMLNDEGKVLRRIDVGAEICGHTFVDGSIYVLRGVEKPIEKWTIARLDPQEKRPEVRDIARVRFACRSLAFDGENFWSNHREANETVAFSLPV